MGSWGGLQHLSPQALLTPGRGAGGQPAVCWGGDMGSGEQHRDSHRHLTEEGHSLGPQITCTSALLQRCSSPPVADDDDQNQHQCSGGCQDQDKQVWGAKRREKGVTALLCFPFCSPVPWRGLSCLYLAQPQGTMRLYGLAKMFQGLLPDFLARDPCTRARKVWPTWHQPAAHVYPPCPRTSAQMWHALALGVGDPNSPAGARQRLWKPPPVQP